MVGITSVSCEAYNLDKREAAYKIGTYLLEAAENGDVKTGDLIEEKEILKLAGENSEIYKTVCNSDFAYMYILDDNNVLMVNDAIFQSVNGYLITNGEEIPDDTILDVPGLHFDGNHICGLTKCGNHSNLYTWHAGL